MPKLKGIYSELKFSCVDVVFSRYNTSTQQLFLLLPGVSENECGILWKKTCWISLKSSHSWVYIGSFVYSKIAHFLNPIIAAVLIARSVHNLKGEGVFCGCRGLSIVRISSPYKRSRRGTARGLKALNTAILPIHSYVLPVGDHKMFY